MKNYTAVQHTKKKKFKRKKKLDNVKKGLYTSNQVLGGNEHSKP